MKRGNWLLFSVILLLSATSFAQQLKVLYEFGSVPNDGLCGTGTLVADRAGNLYGTTSLGGTNGNGGTVFELSKNNDGSWTETTLYSFCFYTLSCPNGSQPVEVVIDRSGNLFGTTRTGGVSCPDDGDVGCGVVFELSPPKVPGDPWNYSVLYSFCSIQVGSNCEDGAGPDGPLTLDASGNIYGSLGSGGEWEGGAVFKLSPGEGEWSETLLYQFCAAGEPYCADGLGPGGGVTFDGLGNLYGTTIGGGNPDHETGGTVYKLTSQSGTYTETLLGVLPFQGFFKRPWIGHVSVDSRNNLYTTYTTYDGRQVSDGMVVRVSAGHKARIFNFDGTDGVGPIAGVVLDQKRKVVYGVTVGSPFGPGNIFKIDESGHETAIYTFCQLPGCADGSLPGGGLLEDKFGNLYGVTDNGGNQTDAGVVFEITP